MGSEVRITLPPHDLEKPWTIDAYRSIGGYEALTRILKDKISRKM